MVIPKKIWSWTLRLFLILSTVFLMTYENHGQSNSYNPTILLKEQDKQLHFGAGMIVSTLGYTWSYNKHQDKKRAMIAGVCTAFAVGVAKELFDGGVQNEYVDPRDIWATTLGGFSMSLTIPLFQPKKRRYRKLDKWNGGYDYDDIPFGDPTIE